MHHRDIMIKIAAKSIPAKFRKLEPEGIFGLTRHGIGSRLLLKCLDHFFGIIAFCGPAFTVYPDTIDAVLVRKLPELGNQQFVNIRPVN